MGTGRCVYLCEDGQRFAVDLRIPEFVGETTTVEFHLSGAAVSWVPVPVLDMHYEDDQLVTCTLSRAGTPFKAEFDIVRVVQVAEERRTSASGLMPASISVCSDAFEEEKVDEPRKKTGFDYVKGLIAGSPRSTDSPSPEVLPAVVKAVKKMCRTNKKLSKRLTKRLTKKAPTLKGRRKRGKLTKKTLKKKRKGAKGETPKSTRGQHYGF